jgi:hypothetical protein
MITSVPPDPTIPEFRSTNINFVAAAVTADIFSYIGAEPLGSSTTTFVLSDPDGTGDEMLRRWNAGLFPKIHPKPFLEARGFLQTEAIRVRKQLGVIRER